MGAYLDALPAYVPLTPARIRALHADARVRRRVREACRRAAVVSDALAAAVATTVRLDGSTSLFVDQSLVVERVTDILGHHPNAFERGFIAGLALAIATEAETETETETGEA